MLSEFHPVSNLAHRLNCLPLRVKTFLLFPVFFALVACNPSSSAPTTATPEEKTAAQASALKATPRPSLPVAFCLDPASWYVNGNGEFSGFEFDLLNAFSEANNLQLTTLPASDNEDLRRKLESAQASVSTGLYQLTLSDSLPRRAKLIWTKPYFSSDIVLVYNNDNKRRPKNWSEVTDDAIVYLRDSGLDSVVYQLAQRYPNLRWRPISASSADAIMEQLDRGVYRYALVASHQATRSTNIHLNVATAFSTGAKLELAWAVPANKPQLRDSLNTFIAEAQSDGLIDRLADRYFIHPRQVNRFDASVFHERIRNDLPQIRRLFYDAELETGIEWRLLAALAYQESQWDPLATSETGVRGLMQITMQTARHLGLRDRLDPSTSVVAGAWYLRQLKGRFPANIGEPDRTWLALASYNIGIGHVEDAQQLAKEQGLDPTLWKDVRKMLPLLTQPEYYEKTRYGYARGGMPVVYVGRIRAYYDILLRQEPDSLGSQLLAVTDK